MEDAWYDTQTASFTDDFLYTYDRDSNVLTRTNALDAAFSQTYTYNGLNELTGYTQGDGSSQNYGLDALGNFTNVTTNGTPQTRTVNAPNQYTSIGSGTSTYDKNGNLTADPTTGNTMVYDAWNRLIAVKNGSTTLASYQFDALGRRVVEVDGTTTRDVYFDGNNAIEERLNGSSTASMQYVWDPLASNTLVEIDQGSSRYYVQQDANGNVTALTDTTGSVDERYVYIPYGAVTIYDATWTTVRSDSSYDMRVLFQGMRYDPATGLYHADERDFSTTMLGWLEVDPIGFAGGTLVQTQFVGDNPVGRMDSTGLMPNGADTIEPQDLIDYIKAVEKQVALETKDSKPRPKEVLRKVTALIRGGGTATSRFSGHQAGQTSCSGQSFGGKTVKPPPGVKRLGKTGWVYVFSKKAGYVDIPHFLYAAYGNAGIPLTTVGGGFVEVWQGLNALGGDTGQYSSAFTFEDIPSNQLGAIFANVMRDDEPLSKQVQRFFYIIKAVGPDQAPKYYNGVTIPATEAGWQSSNDNFGGRAGALWRSVRYNFRPENSPLSVMIATYRFQSSIKQDWAKAKRMGD